MRKATSAISGLQIRLTSERWGHITEEHPELIGNEEEVLRTIDNPQSVYEGTEGELLATRDIEPGKRIVVVYKETLSEGLLLQHSIHDVFALSKEEKKYGNIRLS